MQTHPECFPCFVRQTIIALRQVTDDPAVQERVIKDILPIMAETDMSKPPAYTTTFIHRMIRERLGQDPFKKTKHEYNDIALGLLPSLRKRVQQSEDPLWTAARLAIAGNVIDFGIYSSIDIDGSVARALGPRIGVDDFGSFRETLSDAATVLYLLDNSGEIVFDMLLIRELTAMGKQVTAVVKGSPVLNDVTMDDARQTGIRDLCEVVDNGCDGIGTILDWTSPAFQALYGKTDLVLSKGQGNFETLPADGKETFFLFQAKCEVVARNLGLPSGSMLLQRSAVRR